MHRADQVRVASVSANLRDIDLGAAVREVEQITRDNPLGAGVGMHIGGQREELSQSIRSLLMAFGLAIFLVYLVMASQFESLRSEEHTSELQSLMRISYAVFCLKKKKNTSNNSETQLMKSTRK